MSLCNHTCACCQPFLPPSPANPLQAVCQVLAAGAPLPAPRTLIDTVWNAPGDEFPGLYCTVLPDQPILSAAGTAGTAQQGLVLATSQWRSLSAVVAVDFASGKVTRVTPNNGSCWSLVASGNGGWYGMWLVPSGNGGWCGV